MTTLYGYWSSTYFSEDFWLDDFWQDRIEVFPILTLTQKAPINLALTHLPTLNLTLTQEVA